MCLVSHKQDMANRVDLDHMPQNAVSDQGLYCLLTGISI